MNRALVAVLLLVGCEKAVIEDAGVPVTCASVGGACKGVSDCSKGQGYLTSSLDCAGASTVCCLPLSACASASEFDCCTNTATYRPVCEGGALKCAYGTIRCGTDAGSGGYCATAGGTCGAVSSCGVGQGYLSTTNDCAGGAASVCCLPLSKCSNAVEFECCSGTARFRPSCEAGSLTCADGTTKCVVDAGVPDAGHADAGATDAGSSDAGSSDAGACEAACGIGCAAPGAVCYSDGHDYCSTCYAACHGAVQVSCGG
jgi:hypothetical protein